MGCTLSLPTLLPGSGQSGAAALRAVNQAVTQGPFLRLASHFSRKAVQV